MRTLLEDKRIRNLLIAVLLVLLALGFLNIISTAFSLLIPLALVALGGFAFYKIALEGRGSDDVMADEVAESAGINLVDQAGGADAASAFVGDETADESAARKRLSAVERARSDFFDSSSPAEEILDQIQSRKRRLAGEDDA